MHLPHMHTRSLTVRAEHLRQSVFSRGDPRRTARNSRAQPNAATGLQLLLPGFRCTIRHARIGVRVPALTHACCRLASFPTQHVSWTRLPRMVVKRHRRKATAIWVALLTGFLAYVAYIVWATMQSRKDPASSIELKVRDTSAKNVPTRLTNREG